MAKFEIKIDTKSIQKKMKATEEQIKKGVEQGLKVCASEMKVHEQRLINQRTGHGEYEPTGYLKHSVWIMPLDWSPYGATITVTNVAKYALYTELGTGKEASNGNGRLGGWFYPIGDGTYRFTEGMPPKFFVRDTREYYEDKAPAIIKEQVYRCLR